jgi:hypothetical protein
MPVAVGHPCQHPIVPTPIVWKPTLILTALLTILLCMKKLNSLITMRIQQVQPRETTTSLLTWLDNSHPLVTLIKCWEQNEHLTSKRNGKSMKLHPPNPPPGSGHPCQHPIVTTPIVWKPTWIFTELLTMLFCMKTLNSLMTMRICHVQPREPTLILDYMAGQQSSSGDICQVLGAKQAPDKQKKRLINASTST